MHQLVLWPAAIGVVLLAACAEPRRSAGRAPPAVRVELAAAAERSPAVRATARVQAARRATLRATMPGRVLEALRAGAGVAEDEIVARLDVPSSAAGVDAAAAGLAQARAAERQRARERADIEALAREGAATASELEAARDRESEAAARAAEAVARLRSARIGRAEGLVRAPFAGVLAEASAREGDDLVAGAPVAVLVDPDGGLEAELLLDPTEAAAARTGGRVHASAGAGRAEGRIESVSPVLDPRTGRLAVRVTFDGPSPSLRPGALARFEVEVGEPRAVVLVPERALVRRLGRAILLVVEDGAARAREVRLGAISGGRAEILDGVRAGEAVIVEGTERAVAGEPVRVVEGGQ